MRGKLWRTLPLVALGLAVPAAGETAATAECRIPDGWAEVAAREPHYVVFGESHGTEQSPQFLASLACALVRGGERILLAIEHSAPFDDALQDAWALSGEGFGDALAASGWIGRRDGVASEAMFDMVSGLHALKESGYPIDIVAFNGVKDAEQEQRFAHLPGQGPHEAAQAENIHTAALGGEYDRVLILVGGFHASKDTAELNGHLVEPMARRLSRYGKVISLEMSYDQGTSWQCTLKPDAEPPFTNEDVGCGVTPMLATASYDRAPFIELGTQAREDAPGVFDGFFWVGPVTASPPKFPDSE